MSNAQVPENPNGLIPPDSLMMRLCSMAPKIWNAYINHEFVQGIADGSLPERAFRHYLMQDYLFLIHFARAYGLAVYKADTLTDMRAAATSVSGILEIEMDLHVRYCKDWGLTEAEMAAVPEDPACMAYTRFVLERGMAGDLLDLHVALSPCVVGYGVIGKSLASNAGGRQDGNPYLPWIEMYAGDEYQDIVKAAVTRLDEMGARRGGAVRFDDLARTFESATRLEVGFWQMGLNAARD